MPPEPATKRTVAFVDGQNLFHAAKEAFGYSYPNYDPLKLAQRICLDHGWQLVATRFYTGVPDATVRPSLYHFWNAKLNAMARRGVWTFQRPLRYRQQRAIVRNGFVAFSRGGTFLVAKEKGVDVRIALDVVRLALENEYDVALILSQDQDLSEAADEVRMISIRQNRWIKRACPFPSSPTSRNKRGINGTEWIRIDRATYDACLDPNDYRPKKPRRDK